MSTKLCEVHAEPIHDTTSRRDPIYLFCCHIEWHKHGNIRAYQELVAALDDTSEDIRSVAESLLHRPSPRPRRTPSDPRTFPEHL